MAQLGHSIETADFNNQLEGLDLLNETTKLGETESLVLNDQDKKKYEGKEVPGIKGLFLCEDPSTKKLFLSDGDRLLTKQFDNIKGIQKEGSDMYYIGVNGGKSTLYKSIIGEGKLDHRIINGKIEKVFEKGKFAFVGEPDQEILSSDVDFIDYRIINGELVTIAENNGKKTVKRGEKILGENCDEAIFKKIEGDSNLGECICLVKGGKGKCFIDGKQYGPEIASLNIKDNPRGFEIYKCGDDYMAICNCGTRYKSTFTFIYKGKILYTGLDDAIPNVGRHSRSFDSFQLGDRNVVVVEKGNGKEELYDTKLGKIGTEYDYIDLNRGGENHVDRIDGDYVVTEDRFLIYAKKNGKFVLIVDGEDYVWDGHIIDLEDYVWDIIDGEGIVDKSYPRAHTPYPLSGSFKLILLKKGNKNYYMGKDYILHEYEGQYDNIEKIGKAPDGKIYFIGKKGDEEVFVLDGKIIGKGYNNIEKIGKTPDGKIYFIGKKGDKEVFVFDGKPIGKEYDYISGAGVLPGGGVYVQAERNGEKVFILNGTERKEPTSLDKKTVLFKRDSYSYDY